MTERKEHALQVRVACLQARKVLQLIRGTQDVEEEYRDVLEKAQLAAQIQNPWTLLLFHRKYRRVPNMLIWRALHMCSSILALASSWSCNTFSWCCGACSLSLSFLGCPSCHPRARRPQLVCAACSTLFQQWTGINTIIFYAPQLFLSLGVRPRGSAGRPCTPASCAAHPCQCEPGPAPSSQGSRQDALIATVVVGLCNHFSTYASFWLVRALGGAPFLGQPQARVHAAC